MSVSRTISQIFDGLDSPTAVMFIVGYLCNLKEANQKNEAERILVTLGWRLADRTRKLALSVPTLKTLERIWKDKTQSTQRQKNQFLTSSFTPVVFLSNFPGILEDMIRPLKPQNAFSVSMKPYVIANYERISKQLHKTHNESKRLGDD